MQKSVKQEWIKEKNLYTTGKRGNSHVASVLDSNLKSGD